MTKIPNAPVLYDTVRDTLNENGGSVTNYWPTAFMSSANICSDSKRKPVRLRATACQDYDPSAPNYWPNWWKAYDGLCGFNLDAARAGSFTELVDRYNGSDNGWVYELPIGGDMPLRVGDFGGYAPNARPLADEFIAPNTIYRDQSSFSIAISLPRENEDSLAWTDFDTLKNYYFGVVIRSSNRLLRATAESTLADGGSIVSFSTARLTAGAYTIYPFISSVMYTEQEGDKAMTLYTLPKVTPASVAVVDSAIRIFPAARKLDINGRVAWSIQVTNDTSSAVTFEDNSLRIGRERQQLVGDIYRVIPTATVAARDKAIIAEGEGSIGYRDVDFASTPLMIEVSLSGGRYTITGQVDEGDIGGGGNGEIK